MTERYLTNKGKKHPKNMPIGGEGKSPTRVQITSSHREKIQNEKSLVQHEEHGRKITDRTRA
jgi:hypothetical protein